MTEAIIKVQHFPVTCIPRRQVLEGKREGVHSPDEMTAFTHMWRSGILVHPCQTTDRHSNTQTLDTVQSVTRVNGTVTAVAKAANLTVRDALTQRSAQQAVQRAGTAVKALAFAVQRAACLALHTLTNCSRTGTPYKLPALYHCTRKVLAYMRTTAACCRSNLPAI